MDGMPYHRPSADGIDDETWSLLTRLAVLFQGRKALSARRFVSRGRIPPPRFRVGGLYGVFAVERHIAELSGQARPSEQAIHTFVSQHVHALSRLVTFSAEHVEDVIRQLFDYEPLHTLNMDNVFVLAAAILGVSVDGPVEERLGSLRPWVAAEAARQADLIADAVSYSITLPRSRRGHARRHWGTHSREKG